jgi:hypothetical protein
LNFDDPDPTPIIGGDIPASSPTPNKPRSAPPLHEHDEYDGVQPRQVTVPLSALQQQIPATWSLRAISQPERVALSTIQSYAYQVEPLGYAMIYIIDSGVDPTSEVNLLSIVLFLLLMLQGIPRLYRHTQRSGASLVVSRCQCGPSGISIRPPCQ